MLKRLVRGVDLKLRWILDGIDFIWKINSHYLLEELERENKLRVIGKKLIDKLGEDQL